MRTDCLRATAACMPALDRLQVLASQRSHQRLGNQDRLFGVLRFASGIGRRRISVARRFLEPNAVFGFLGVEHRSVAQRKHAH